MRQFLHRHARKILIGHGAVIGVLTTSMLIGAPRAVLFFDAPSESLEVGSTMELSIMVHANDPINAMGMTVNIPPHVEIDAIDTEESFFDLWTEKALQNEAGDELRLSGGTLMKGGVTGTHPAIKLTVRGKQPGEAVFTFKEADVRAHDSLGSLVPAELRPFSITIPDPSGTSETVESMRELSRADFDEKNGVTIADMSILIKHLLGPYDSRYDLNRDGYVSLQDLSIFFGMMTD